MKPEGGGRGLPTRGEWLGLVALAPGTLGVCLAFFSLVARFEEGDIVLGVAGWHYPLAVLTWAAVLAGGLVPAVRRVPGLPARAAAVVPVLAAALGGLALAALIAALVHRPEVMEIAASAVEHIDREELVDVTSPTVEWTRIGGGVRYGAGVYLLALATLLLLVGGLLQIRQAARPGRRPGS